MEDIISKYMEPQWVLRWQFVLPNFSWQDRRTKKQLVEKDINMKHIGNKYGLLTKCEVKMAGYWSSSLLRVHGPRRDKK